MKLNTPDSDLPFVRVTTLFANDSKSNMVSGGGRTVEIDDAAVEALLVSFNPQGKEVRSAWVKDFGYMSIEAYTDRKHKEAELDVLRQERKDRVKREKAATTEKSKPVSED